MKKFNLQEIYDYWADNLKSDVPGLLLKIKKDFVLRFYFKDYIDLKGNRYDEYLFANLDIEGWLYMCYGSVQLALKEDVTPKDIIDAVLVFAEDDCFTAIDTFTNYRYYVRNIINENIRTE